MTNVEARLKVKGKQFEILVDVDKALQLRKGMNVSMENILAIDQIFYDTKKGLKITSSDLNEYFGTTDMREAARKIVLQGEILLPMEYRQKERDDKIKQVVDFLSRNAIDPTTGKPHTPMRITEALKQAGVNIDNKPIDMQISHILSQIAKIIPIRIETKKLRIRVPAVYTGRAYSVIQDYKEKEDWMDNGDLSCVINLPAGLQMEFYDKLNAITHGSAIVEEIKN